MASITDFRSVYRSPNPLMDDKVKVICELPDTEDVKLFGIKIYKKKTVSRTEVIMTRREAIAHRDKMDVSLYASVWIEGIPDQESEEKIDEKFSDFKENPDELESKPVTMEDNIDELNKIINIVK